MYMCMCVRACVRVFVCVDVCICVEACQYIVSVCLFHFYLCTCSKNKIAELYYAEKH